MKGKQTLEDLQKVARLNEEIKRLNKILSKVDKKTKKAVHSLIENAAFMAITLEDLQQHINRHGTVTEYQNGENQWGTKKSPEVEIYNTMIKNHMAVMKQLTDLIPKEETKPLDDGFDGFVVDK
jgi:nicotinic acid mononucleotide adenylyltransferase